MSKMFTPAEANTLYNKCKITWNPKSYSLKDGLKLDMGVADLAKQHITKCTFGAEEHLARVIHEFHGHSGTPEYGIATVFRTPKTPIWESGGTVGIQPADVCFSKKDNMYIALDQLVLLGFDSKKLKGGRMLDAILQTCIALTSSDSCTADIHWLACEGFSTVAYERLHNFEELKDALAHQDETLPVYLSNQHTLCQCVPTVNLYGHTMSGSLYNTGFDISYAKKLSPVTVATQYLYTMYYILEVLWATKTLSEQHLKDLISTYIHTVKPAKASELERLFFDFSGPVWVLNPDIEAAVSVVGAKERFNAYRELALKLDFNRKATEFADRFAKGDSAVLCSAGLGTLVGFAQTYSNTWVRVNHCKIMYEYASTNNLLDTAMDDDAAEAIEMLGMHEDSSTSTGMSATTEREATDLMSLTVGSKSGTSKASSPIESYTSPTYEALDSVKAKYTDGRYEFKTEDCVDFSDAARVRYDAIAKKVSLVNRLLTQKLREIKTYNTGGKQPGLESGRIDRKAVYRYKYDPNIFYKNTYKQLESDLAFGIILDISGSMYGKGIENGRITMIVLHETLKALGINHSIIGHTSHGEYQCTIERYQSFREDKTYNTRKNYALANLEAQSGNCDSASLFYMEKALLRAKNRDKICVIFSDGQPTECTGTDLREQVAHMERNGIKVIGIGINFPEIADYYKDYANGKNLPEMLNIVTDILKEYILKKKERA